MRPFDAVHLAWCLAELQAPDVTPAFQALAKVRFGVWSSGAVEGGVAAAWIRAADMTNLINAFFHPERLPPYTHGQVIGPAAGRMSNKLVVNALWAFGVAGQLGENLYG